MVHPTLVPLNARVIARYGDKWTQPGNFVGNGAYTLGDWIVNERVSGVRNPRYWDDAHTVIDRVTYLPIASETAGFNRYRAGELDISSIPSPQFAACARSWAMRSRSSPSSVPTITTSIPVRHPSMMRGCAWP
ncbi:Periplasmic oligopeptide-binding protein precursor [Edwardsiella tarda]|nr:Periplasmic oligopeptide-binding protein precursor [Edwardsiella tarda]